MRGTSRKSCWRIVIAGVNVAPPSVEIVSCRVVRPEKRTYRLPSGRTTGWVPLSESLPKAGDVTGALHVSPPSWDVWVTSLFVPKSAQVR